MMARKPAERYQTPAEVVDALLPFTVAEPPIADVPRMELDDRIPLAMPVAAVADGVPLAQAILPPQADKWLDVPLAQPIAMDVPMAPWADAPTIASPPSPFSLSAADGPSPPDVAATPPAQSFPVAGKKALDRRLVVGLAAGGAALFFLLIWCGGWTMVKWYGNGPNPDAYPAGAELQIPEAFLSSHDWIDGQERDPLPIGSRKNVIVRIRRVKFNGEVELRLEGLPSGVTSSKILLKAGSEKIEVPIMASYGIDPCVADIRIVGTAKNLTAEKTLKVHVISDKKAPK
jgi:hypothetical protein